MNELWESDCEQCCLFCFMDCDKCITSCIYNNIPCTDCKLAEEEEENE